MRLVSTNTQEAPQCQPCETSQEAQHGALWVAGLVLWQHPETIHHSYTTRKIKLAATLRWFTAAPKPPKIEVFGVTQPPGVAQPLYSRDTTRPGHVTYVLVWSKSDQRRLRKTLHKQTDRETDTTKTMVTWPWTNSRRPRREDLCTQTNATTPVLYLEFLPARR